MGRLGIIVAGLIFAALTAAPASANTIAMFSLDNVTYDDGQTVSGTFTLDVTAHSITAVSIADSDGGLLGIYSDPSQGTYTSSPTQTNLSFGSSFFLGTTLLRLEFALTDSTNLLSLPTFNPIAGGEDTFIVFCPFGYCGTRSIISGSINTVSVANVATTPIPASLPLLATALGGLGLVGWRRKRQAA